MLEAFLAMIDPATGTPVDGAPVGALLTAHALVTPTAPALTIEGRTFDFATLDAAANRRARLLAGHGIGPDAVILIALPNSFAYYVTCFAIWKLGATPCHISASLTDFELNAIATLARPALAVMIDPDRLTGIPLLQLDPVAEAALASSPMPPIAARCFRIATSGGSTGQPKLIVDPTPASWGADKTTVRRAPRTVLLNAAPLYHSAPFALMQLGLCQGSHVVDLQAFEPSTWLAAADRHRANWAYIVPTMMTRIAKLADAESQAADLSALRTILHMAAPCPAWAKRWWIERIGSDAVWEVYGGTERIGATTIGGTEWLAHPGSVGRARPGQQIVILDDHGSPAPTGTIGEIYFRKDGGPGSTYRYIGSEAQGGSEARVQGDLESFGDLGWLDPDGYLFLADRRTDMIVSGGVNFYPAEIEAAIEAIDGVVACAVVGLPDADLGQRIHAIVQRSVTAEVTQADVLTGVATRLARVKHPRSVEIITDPLRNDAGKMRRRDLRDARLARDGKQRAQSGIVP